VLAFPSPHSFFTPLFWELADIKSRVFFFLPPHRCLPPFLGCFAPCFFCSGFFLVLVGILTPCYDLVVGIVDGHGSGDLQLFDFCLETHPKGTPFG